MSKRSGPWTTLRAAATFAANDTWYATTNTIRMGDQANGLRLYVTVATASVGSVEFYVKHSPDSGTTWFDYCSSGDAPEVWGNFNFTGAATKSYELSGLNLYPREDVQVYFRASAGAASATVKIQALSFMSSAPSTDIATGDLDFSGAVSGDVAHDAVDSGSPLKIGGHARETERAAVAEGDRVDAVFDLTGEQVIAGYTWATDLIRVAEQSPDSERYQAGDLADTTNVAAATHYYPDSDGTSMDGWRDLSLSGKLIDADGTLTLTLEVTNDEDTSGGDWIQVYVSDDKNNTTVNELTVTNGTLTYAVSANNCNYRYARWKLVASGATNTVILKQKQKAL